jgi:hypothetical protein
MTITGYLKLRRRIREIVYKEDLPLFFEQYPDLLHPVQACPRAAVWVLGLTRMWSVCRPMPTFMCSAPAYVAYMKEFAAKYKEVVASWQGWNVRDPATLSALQQVWSCHTKNETRTVPISSHSTYLVCFCSHR